MADPTDPMWRFLVEQIKDRLGTLRITPVTDEDLPDFIGHVNHVRVMAQGLVTAAKSEVDDRAIGAEYKMEPAGYYQRSYNLPSILAAAMKHGGAEFGQHPDLVHVLRAMLDEDVLGITTWTKLQKFCERHGIPITEAPYEITEGDPDGVMVGKYWKSKPANVEALEKEQT